MEFLAEDELVDIVPSGTKEEIPFVERQFGRFRAAKESQVPLWLAIQLYKSKKWQIKPPAWLEVEWLSNKFNEENANEEDLTEMPPRYIEISKILLHNAREVLQNADAVWTKLQDIQDIRQCKIVKQLKALRVERNEATVRFRHISKMELHGIRPFLLSVLNSFQKITDVKAQFEGRDE